MTIDILCQNGYIARCFSQE